MRRLFRRFNAFLSRKKTGTASDPKQPLIPSPEELTFELLWDDYERRTGSHHSAPVPLNTPNTRLLHWIGSIDRSGYRREECLRALITNRVPGDENRILLRLTDWVPQVQAIARDWILANFRLLPLDAVSENQGLILYLARKDRLRGDAGMREIERDLLARTRTMDPTQFLCFIPEFRRYLFSLSCNDDHHLRSWMLDDPDPFNRLMIFAKIGFSDLTSDERQRLEGDRSVMVRRRLFHAQLEAGVSPDRAQLIGLALEADRRLRELGQFYLNSNFGESTYSMYCSLVGEQFYYIADFARSEDADHFIEGVRHGSRSTKYNCLRALASAAPERLKDLGIAALLGQSRRFRSFILPLLPQLLSIEEILALRPAFENASPPRTMSFLRVIERKCFWTYVDEGLGFLISDPESGMQAYFHRAISSKVMIFVSPSVQQRESINRKLSKLRSLDQRQNKGLADLIEHTLRTAR